MGEGRKEDMEKELGEITKRWFIQIMLCLPRGFIGKKVIQFK